MTGPRSSRSRRKRRSRVLRAALRHALARNASAYERILAALAPRRDLWLATQGEIEAWWRARCDAALRVEVRASQIVATTDLPGGVVEGPAGLSVGEARAACPNANFEGRVEIALDPKLPELPLLRSLLVREGIPYLGVSERGALRLCATRFAARLEPLLGRARERDGRLWRDDATALAALVAELLAERGLPLMRLWYHPQVDGRIVRYAFSPRFDVDRAISLVPLVRSIEARFGAAGTYYVRAFSPFYGEAEIRALARQIGRGELALHGEFVTNAARFGGEGEAARAEKERLEEWTGRPIRGVSMHGGELRVNRSPLTPRAVREAGLRYDSTTPGTPRDHLPAYKLVDGSPGDVLALPQSLGDVDIPPNRHYADAFSERAVERMDAIAAESGILVMLFHPIYFACLDYLRRPSSWAPMLRSAFGRL